MTRKQNHSRPITLGDKLLSKDEEYIREKYVLSQEKRKKKYSEKEKNRRIELFDAQAEVNRRLGELYKK